MRPNDHPHNLRMIYMNELLEALASPHFHALRKYKQHWGIAHLSFDGVSIVEIYGNDLRQLLDQWADINKALEIAAEDRQRLAKNDWRRGCCFEPSTNR